MPIYEYECKDCQAVFEILVTASSANDEVTCSQCKSKKVVKQLSAFVSGGNVSGGDFPQVPPAGGCGSSGSGFS